MDFGKAEKSDQGEMTVFVKQKIKIISSLKEVVNATLG